MINFLTEYKNELIATGFVLVVLQIIRFIIHFTISKIGKKSHINDARIRLIKRYISVTLLLIAILIESYIFGTEFRDLAVIFSSVFAVIGIGLFAIDKDFPITAIIEDIRAFQLHLRTQDGDLVTYPNNLMLQKAVTLIEKDAIDDIVEDDAEAV